MAKHIPSYTDNAFGDGAIDEECRARHEHSVAPHVDSFNYFLDHGIDQIVQDMLPMPVQCRATDNVDAEIDCDVKLSYGPISIENPARKDGDVLNNEITPRECREGGSNYSGALLGKVFVNVDGAEMNLDIRLGSMPIMVMSDKCHLKGKNSKQLVQLKEEANEVGGYFILNGNEKVVRLLQVPRRNFVIAIERSSFKNRGTAYSDKGVAIRCARKDQSSVTIVLHYLNNGGATLKFVLRKQEFLLPVVMVAKALMDISDQELFDRVVQGDVNNTFLTTRLELLLQDFKPYKLNTKSQCLAYMGSLFRVYLPVTEGTSDEDAGTLLVTRYLFVNAKASHDKLEILLHMMRKLFCFAQGKCTADNPDSMMNQELLLPGHLITMYLKEKMEELLMNVRGAIIRDYRYNKVKFLNDCKGHKYFERLFSRYGDKTADKIATFLSTGNIISSTGMDLQQVSGYTIMAERLNIFRYMSHFQSVHRGQFFTTMKTTTPRKLLPESWGFLCPVHTPDGSPCGLLNHLAKDAVVLTYPPSSQMPRTRNGLLRAQAVSQAGNASMVNSKEHVHELLCSLGMVSAGLGGGDGQIVLTPEHIPVTLDGLVLGGILASQAADLVKQLRFLKVQSVPYGGNKKLVLDPTIELAYFPKTSHPGVYPGLYIHTEPGRMIRPVMQLKGQAVEWIGVMEQVFMEIACLESDLRIETTHVELEPTAMLSQIASMTPYSDYNQSPRNMYQCQMGKQTMGTPVHAWKHRADNKLYRIQNIQAPIVQTKTHGEYCMDEYPQGCNAVVAVIAYTGYDMEDAMIISKSSFERGFGHGSVYKTFTIDLDEEEKRVNKQGVKPNFRFGNIKSDSIAASQSISFASEKYSDGLDFDGLPFEGTHIVYGSPLCCLIDGTNGEHKLVLHKDHESAYVQTVRVIGTKDRAAGDKKKSQLRKVSITMRYRRNPVIGDKFSSRHGQKGTLSVLWPQENMPFSEGGMSPDVLINPHAFPSRMTIGMLIESMAGKSGAMNGQFQDSSPFQFHEEDRVIDHLGEQMRALGYHYYGSEPLYNGLTGNVMQADIFMGLVYYQRLRHMVSDKSQVRSTGAVMTLTRQPVKGRKKHGGIRLGEMERDALVSHGVSFCLQDRLMNCSDAHLAYMCACCGSLLTVYAQPAANTLTNPGAFFNSPAQQFCSTCQSSEAVQPVNLPYVFRYLTNELAAMGIKLTLKTDE